MIFNLSTDNARKQALEAVQRAKPGWVVSIQPPNRSAAQNSFYWAMLTAISEQIRPGKTHDRDVWHEYFKTLFLPTRMVELPGNQLIELPATTTNLSKSDFSQYVDKVSAWAMEHGLMWTDEMSAMRVDKDTQMLA